MIQPTIGRVVLFVPAESCHDFGFCINGGREHAAIIAYVHSDRLVSLSVFDAIGRQFGRTMVTLVQPEDSPPQGDHCKWMEYQKGQAAKTEALEKKAAGS